MIWVAGRSPTLVSHSLRGAAMNLKATTLTYLAIKDSLPGIRLAFWVSQAGQPKGERLSPAEMLGKLR